MLVAQAKRSSEQFTGTVIDDDSLGAGGTRCEPADLRNIILIGMPGSGKVRRGRRSGQSAGPGGSGG